MKYRIKEVKTGFDTTFYPQYKLLFWHCFYDMLGGTILFVTLDRAKDWLNKQAVKTKIKIHGI